MKGLHVIAIDLLLGLDGLALEGQRELERYLAKVAQLDVWVAAHPDERGAP